MSVFNSKQSIAFKVHLAVGALSLLATTFAIAGQKDVCKEDFSRLCSAQTWNTKNMLSCFKKHPGELQPGCASYTSRVRGGIVRYDTLQDTCQKDYASLCGTNVFKVNRAKTCLKDNRPKVSASCGASYDTYFAYLKSGNPSYIPEDSYDTQVDPMAGSQEFAGRRSGTPRREASLTSLAQQDAAQGKMLKKNKDRKGDLQRNAFSRIVDNMSNKASGLLGMKKDDESTKQ